MIQDFDLTARWSTLLHAHFTEAVHNIAQLWPDVQSLEVSYQIIEGFDHDFAQSILSQPDLHYDASNRALRELLERYESARICTRAQHVSTNHCG